MRRGRATAPSMRLHSALVTIEAPAAKNYRHSQSLLLARVIGSRPCLWNRRSPAILVVKAVAAEQVEKPWALDPGNPHLSSSSAGPELASQALACHLPCNAARLPSAEGRALTSRCIKELR